MKKYVTALLLIIFAFSASAQTPDAMEKIKMKMVPDPVLSSFIKMYPNTKVEQWLSGNKYYDAKFTENRLVQYARFNREGLFVDLRTKLNWEDAPQPLKDGLNKTEQKYWKVEEFYAISKMGELSYYIIQLRSDRNELKTLYFDKEGSLDVKSHSGH